MQVGAALGRPVDGLLGAGVQGVGETAGDENAASQVIDRTPKGPGRDKRNASSRTKGARRQAKRDNR